MEVSTGLECEVHRVKPGRGYYLLYDWVSQKGASDGREHAPGSAQVGLLRDRAACPSRGRPAPASRPRARLDRAWAGGPPGEYRLAGKWSPTCTSGRPGCLATALLRAQVP